MAFHREEIGTAEAGRPGSYYGKALALAAHLFGNIALSLVQLSVCYEFFDLVDRHRRIYIASCANFFAAAVAD